MKRLLMFVGVAVVAAAMYVAASPASQQSSGPSAKQFAALKKQVTSQGKQLKAVKQLALAEAVVIVDCMAATVPINQFGDNTVAQTEGYNYSQPSGAGNFLTTALDVTDPADTNALWVTGGTAQSNCQGALGGALHRVAQKAGVRLPGATSRLGAFSAHRP